jgi:hypothetical protein
MVKEMLVNDRLEGLSEPVGSQTVDADVLYSKISLLYALLHVLVVDIHVLRTLVVSLGGEELY